MASKKIPKLVIKSSKATRKLEIPGEAKPQGQEGRELIRATRASRRAAMINRAKNSLRIHAHLMVIGVCAMVVMYGIAASIANSNDNNPQDTEVAGPRIPSVTTPGNDNGLVRSDSSGLGEQWICMDEKNNIYKRIITTQFGTKTKLYVKKKYKGGETFTPYKPEKPKSVLSSDQEDAILAPSNGTMAQ